MSPRRKFPPCPSCGSADRPLRIVYGYPSGKTIEDARAGKFALGGCVIGPESPDFECRTCGAPLPWPARRPSAAVRAG